MAGRLEDKVAIVTGAGSIGPGWGNGKAVAVLFAREGANVMALDINLEAAQETAAIVAAEGGRCTARRTDVTRGDEVADAVAHCIDIHGRIDVLHNNVGIAEVGGPITASEESWDRVNAVNLKSMFLTCKHVLPHMVARGAGTIVNVASIAGIRWMGVPYISYSATKAAILAFSRSVALEHAGDGIRCNSVLPGLMDTPMVEHALRDFYADGDIARMKEIRGAQCPTGRVGDAWDVAFAALYLASDEAKYVTAAELVVDGGVSAKSA